MIRVVLPTHLRRLANVSREVNVQVDGDVTIDAVLDVLEKQYPMLRGTIRDQISNERRAFVRYFVTGEDWSLEPSDKPLPDAVASGVEPLWVVGAMAGG